MDITTTTALSDDVAIPVFGLGVYRTGSGDATRNAVRWALQAGYRHVDTARVYGNEREVGEAIRASDVPRDEVFVTTKLWNDDQGYDEALRAYDASLEALGLDQADLFLLHWPVQGKRVDSWRALCRLREEGRVRSIGVSNFMPHHLREIIDATGVVPAIDQIELHPFGQQREAVASCRELGIVIEAYSPLTKGRHLDDDRLVAIAEGVGRTVAQVLIRWSLQKGHVVIPKSSNRGRIRENADVFDFELDEGVMARLDARDEGLHTAWDPSSAP